MEKLITLHKDFFKLVLENKRIARDALKAHLPQQHIDEFDWDTLNFEAVDSHEVAADHICTTVLSSIQYGEVPIYIIFHLEPFLTKPVSAFNRITVYRRDLMLRKFFETKNGIPAVIAILYACFNIPRQHNSDIDDDHRKTVEDTIPIAYCPGPTFVVDIPQVTDESDSNTSQMLVIDLLLKYSIIKPILKDLSKFLAKLSHFGTYPLRLHALKYLFQHWQMDHHELLQESAKYFDEKTLASVVSC